MTNTRTQRNDASSPVLTAPDGCTTFHASSIPSAQQIADWCHPRSDPQRWLHASVTPVPVGPTRLLGVWAHPDDESYLSAGLMARTIADGGHVTVVAITDGEDGFPADDPRPPEQRAAQRRRELRSAMELIGVRDIRFLGVPDGGVADAAHDALVDRIADIMVDVDPDVIVTFGPDGITGHPDHVANSAIATEAWMNAGTGDLWYAAKTDEWLDEWRELHDEFGVWMTEEPTGVRDDEVEEIVDLVGGELDAKRAVLGAHRSQTEGLSQAFGEQRYRRWICQETFRRPDPSDLTPRGTLAGAVA
jgi:LmbE family N-acetylglucosaminyl deacetylase